MNFEIGLTALRASQFAINNISHNIANVDTEDFHRQEVLFESNQVRLDVTGTRRISGGGVSVGEVRRFRSLITENSLTNANSDLSRIGQQLNIESRVEALIAPGDLSIQDALNALFDEFARLSANPAQRTLRSSVLNEANNLANRIRNTSDEFANIQYDIRQQLDLEVDQLNQDLQELVELQNEIRTSYSTNGRLDQLDRRDQLVNRIAERVDVQRLEYVQDQMGLSIAGGSINIDTSTIEFESGTNANGDLEIRLAGQSEPVSLVSGRISALIDTHNNLLTGYGNEVDGFAQQLIRRFDQIHAVGVGPDGSFGILASQRAVGDVDLPLAESAIFPVEPGELSITVTDPSGNRTTSTFSIDPSQDSLSDVANRITAIANVSAVVDPDTGRMTVFAAGGHEFDFTGGLTNRPDLSAYTGTSSPRISGSYFGENNEVYTVTAVTGGTVGKTSGLTLRATDSQGNLVREFEIGEDYQAGAKISLDQGIEIEFPIGDVVAGDTFEFVAVANSDTTGVLAAIGMNSMFSGTNATNIQVAERLRNSPNALATSKSGDVSDTRNLEAVIELRESLTLREGQSTFEGFLQDLNAEIGFRVQTSLSIEAGLSELQFQFQTERETISGVDVNEELIRLTQFQKSYEAAVQIVRTMETMLDDLFNLIR